MVTSNCWSSCLTMTPLNCGDIQIPSLNRFIQFHVGMSVVDIVRWLGRSSMRSTRTPGRLWATTRNSNTSRWPLKPRRNTTYVPFLSEQRNFFLSNFWCRFDFLQNVYCYANVVQLCLSLPYHLMWIYCAAAICVNYQLQGVLASESQWEAWRPSPKDGSRSL